MRIYEIRYFVKRTILDKNLKLTHRWFIYKCVKYNNKSLALKDLNWYLRYDREAKVLHNVTKYTFRCIERGKSRV